jgi:hypothetical protein
MWYLFDGGAFKIFDDGMGLHNFSAGTPVRDFIRRKTFFIQCSMDVPVLPSGQP